MLYQLLKLKKLFVKLITCWIFPESLRKNTRNFLFYFSFTDFIKFKNQNFKIVSLGTNCLPRVFTTAIKLKPRKIYGEKTGPFDLAVHKNINKIADCIENDFQNFFNGLIFDNHWQNPKLDAIYIHDDKLTKQQFIKRYKKRINNFTQILNYPKTVYFIFSDYEQNTKAPEIIHLCNILKIKRNGKPFKLVILTAHAIPDFLGENVIQLIDDKFKIEDGNWVELCINEYGNINNRYTKFCKSMGEKLKEFVYKNS